MKKIAFSILNRNGLSDSIECIDSLLKSDTQDFDVYLIDNGSTDYDEFESLQKRYKDFDNIIINRSNVNLGFTGGNNFNLNIIKQKSYDFVCLLNNDCLVTPGFLSNIIKKIQDIKIDGIFGPIIRNLDRSIQSCGSMINLRLGTNPRLKKISGPFQEVDCISGSCFIISKRVFEDVGLLDDAYFAYREESDYCTRAKKLGYPIISINSEGIVHKEETANNKKKAYYTYLMFRNRILFLKKYSTILQYIISWGILVVYMIVVFPRVFGIGNYKHAVKGIRDGINDTQRLQTIP